MNRWYTEIFPNLNSANHTRKSPCDESYNCVAWAADRNDVIWWPREDHIWPIENKYGETVEAVVALFEWLGYYTCKSEVFEQGYEKIVIYAKSENAKVVPKHVAKQTAEGFWTSKLGLAMDIVHERVENLNSRVYGEPIAFMKRKQKHEN